MLIKPRRTQEERRAGTRQALRDAGRALFVEKGYAATSTPEVVTAAKVSRGALYHHFADKRALLWAVLEHESVEVRRAIEQATSSSALTAREALIAGSLAYLDAMAVPGRTRLLLVDGPAVFGHDAMTALDADAAAGSLRHGLRAVLGDGPMVPALADLLSAAFDHAALASATGERAPAYRAAMLMLIERAIETG